MCLPLRVSRACPVLMPVEICRQQPPHQPLVFFLLLQVMQTRIVKKKKKKLYFLKRHLTRCGKDTRREKVEEDWMLVHNLRWDTWNKWRPIRVFSSEGEWRHEGGTVLRPSPRWGVFDNPFPPNPNWRSVLIVIWEKKKKKKKKRVYCKCGNGQVQQDGRSRIQSRSKMVVCRFYLCVCSLKLVKNI